MTITSGTETTPSKDLTYAIPTMEGDSKTENLVFVFILTSERHIPILNIVLCHTRMICTHRDRDEIFSTERRSFCTAM